MNIKLASSKRIVIDILAACAATLSLAYIGLAHASGALQTNGPVHGQPGAPNQQEKVLVLGTGNQGIWVKKSEAIGRTLCCDAKACLPCPRKADDISKTKK